MKLQGGPQKAAHPRHPEASLSTHIFPPIHLHLPNSSPSSLGTSAPGVNSDICLGVALSLSLGQSSCTM